MKLNHLCRVFSLIWSLSIVGPLFAQQTPAPSLKSQKWYQVEMIIFSQIPYGEKQHEIWPAMPAFNPPAQIISLVPPQLYQNTNQQATTTNFPLVIDNEFLLSDEAMHLSHNPNYQIIGHLAWLQPITDSQAVPTYIQASNNISNFDALIRLQQKRFIQLNMQAVTSIQDSAFSKDFKQLKTLDDNGVVRFILNSSIRLKVNELNYMDSPFFGVLLKITPHAAPLQKQANNQQNINA